MKHKNLTSRVMAFPKRLPRYARKRYVPYCDLGSHQGFILREDICKARRCEHYYKLYLEKRKT